MEWCGELYKQWVCSLFDSFESLIMYFVLLIEDLMVLLAEKHSLLCTQVLQQINVSSFNKSQKSLENLICVKKDRVTFFSGTNYFCIWLCGEHLMQAIH